MTEEIRKYKTRKSIYTQKIQLDELGDLKEESWERQEEGGIIALVKSACYISREMYHVLMKKRDKSYFELIEDGKKAKYNREGGRILFINQDDKLLRSGIVKEIEPPFKKDELIDDLDEEFKITDQG